MEREGSETLRAVRGTGARQIDPKAVQQKLDQILIPAADTPGLGLPSFDLAPPKIE